jgi:hypothetical protein
MGTPLIRGGVPGRLLRCAVEVSIVLNPLPSVQWIWDVQGLTFLTAPVKPEPPGRFGDVEHRYRTARIDRPRHHGPQVGQVGGQPCVARRGIRAAQPGLRTLGQRDGEVQVAVARRAESSSSASRAPTYMRSVSSRR